MPTLHEELLRRPESERELELLAERGWSLKPIGQFWRYEKLDRYCTLIAIEGDWVWLRDRNQIQQIVGGA